MKIAFAVIILYAIGIVILTQAWSVASIFLVVSSVLLGMAKLFTAFLPRYHAHIIRKIVENELRIEEQSGQIS